MDGGGGEWKANLSIDTIVIKMTIPSSSITFLSLFRAAPGNR